MWQTLQKHGVCAGWVHLCKETAPQIFPEAGVLKSPQGGGPYVCARRRRRVANSLGAMDAATNVASSARRDVARRVWIVLSSRASLPRIGAMRLMLPMSLQSWLISCRSGLTSYNPGNGVSGDGVTGALPDRKSTRLNSSHVD